jgi:hypothetical protein
MDKQTQKKTLQFIKTEINRLDKLITQKIDASTYFEEFKNRIYNFLHANPKVFQGFLEILYRIRHIKSRNRSLNNVSKSMSKSNRNSYKSMSKSNRNSYKSTSPRKSSQSLGGRGRSGRRKSRGRGRSHSRRRARTLGRNRLGRGPGDEQPVDEPDCGICWTPLNIRQCVQHSYGIGNSRHHSFHSNCLATFQESSRERHQVCPLCNGRPTTPWVTLDANTMMTQQIAVRGYQTELFNQLDFLRANPEMVRNNLQRLAEFMVNANGDLGELDVENRELYHLLHNAMNRDVLETFTELFRETERVLAPARDLARSQRERDEARQAFADAANNVIRRLREDPIRGMQDVGHAAFIVVAGVAAAAAAVALIILGVLLLIGCFVIINFPFFAILLFIYG